MTPAPASARPLSHTSVLLDETVEAVCTDPDGLYVDGTFGRGGHARALLARLSPRGRLIAFDRDPEAVAAAAASDLAGDARFAIVHAPFAQMAEHLAARGAGPVRGLMLDLGISSPQIDDPARGFSFRFDGPLDMRMDPTRGESAADFLARADEREMAEVIRDYGEERFAGAIARALVASRAIGQAPTRTAALAQIVARAVKTREGGQDPATRTFQALRIHVNGELDELRAALSAALALLAPAGRLAVISFHSLEDRIVKQFIASHSKEVVDRRQPFAAPQALALQALARIKPSEGETRANPRARSAVLRVAERTDAPLATGGAR